MLKLNEEEFAVVESVQKCHGVEIGLFELTETQLSKGIIDANKTIVASFLATGFHDFAVQGNGKTNKVLIEMQFLTNEGMAETIMSLYRPETKNGDPRLWIYKLPTMMPNCKSGDRILLAQNGKRLLGVNLSEALREKFDTGILIESFKVNAGLTTVAEELLGKLEAFSCGAPLPDLNGAANAVGLAIEAALGIKPNPNQAPDYKGIELKSTRDLIRNRQNLKSLVPVLHGVRWEGSKISSYQEIVKQFGYIDDDTKLLALANDVWADKPNSQGLQLFINEIEGVIELVHIGDQNITPVSVWGIDDLYFSIAKKHKETFWIEADTVHCDAGLNKEGFLPKYVLHTTGVSRIGFLKAIQEGRISVCLTGRFYPAGHRKHPYNDHGMLWKIKSEDFPSVLGVVGEYKLGQ